MSSILNSLRDEMVGTMPEADANGLIVLPGDALGIKVIEGKRYVRFVFGQNIVTKAAIDRAVQKRKITADWSPVAKDENGVAIVDAEGKPVILDEVHIQLLESNVPIATDDGMVGFGTRGTLVTADMLR